MKEKDKNLPKDWPDDWPQNLDEFVKVLKSPKLLEYLEDIDLYLRFDDKNGKVRIERKKV